MSTKQKYSQSAEAEIERLQSQLAEAEETLQAIRSGAVDAFVVSGPQGDRLYTLAGAAEPYRVLIEQMNQGAATLSPDGLILYCNQRFAELLQVPQEKVIGAALQSFVVPTDWPGLKALLQTSAGVQKSGELMLKLAEALLPARFAVSGLPGESTAAICLVATNLAEDRGREIALLNMMEDLLQAKNQLELTNRALVKEIAERQLAEEKFRKLNVELEQRVADRTQELNRRMTELQTVFETVPVGLAIAEDPEGRHIRGNPTIERLTGTGSTGELSLTSEKLPPYRARGAGGKEVPPSDLPMQRACRGETVTDWIMEIQRPDGATSILQSNATPLRDENGQPRGAVGAFMDVTAMKQAEEALRLSELRFHTIYDTAPVSIWQEDWSKVIAMIKSLRNEGVSDFAAWFHEHPDFVAQALASVKILDVNQWTVEMFHARDKTELLASLETIFATPDTLPGFVNELIALTRGEQVYRTEIALNTVRGEQISGLLAMSFPPESDSGSVLVSVIDITDRKKAENALRESEELRRAVMDNSPDAIYVKDLQSRWLLGNPEVLRIVGKTAEEALGKSDRELYADPDIGRAILENDRRILASGKGESFEEIADTPDGRRTFQSLKAPRRDAQGNIIGLIGISRDITEKKRAEQALARQREELQLILDSCPAFIFYKDTRNRFLRVNQAFANILRRKKEELEGHTIPELFPREQAEAYWQDDREVMASGKPKLGIIEPMQTPEGSRWLQTDKIPICDPADNVSGVIGFSVDITERKAAEEALRRSEERFKAIASQTPDHLLVQDQDLRYELVINPRLNLTVEQMLGRTDYDILSKEDADQVTAIKRKVLQTGEAIHVEMPLISRGNEQHFFDGSYVPRFDAEGRVNGLIGYFRDITERKRTEAQVRKLNEELQHRAAELEAANKELESFSYSVSHDLRAPLRAIDGFSRILLEDFSDKLGTAGGDNLRRICDATSRMGQLIDDLLGLSRVTRGEMHLRPVNLSELVAQVAAALPAATPGRTAEFRIQPGLVVEGDQNLLQIVLENLLGNAWKFTSRQPQPIIEFGSKKITGLETFYVRDNGVGYDMTYASKLFGAFQRLHSTKDFPGTGIGLATVQRIIHRHGGRVWAESRVGRGATFYFTLTPHKNGL